MLQFATESKMPGKNTLAEKVCHFKGQDCRLVKYAIQFLFFCPLLFVIVFCHFFCFENGVHVMESITATTRLLNLQGFHTNQEIVGFVSRVPNPGKHDFIECPSDVTKPQYLVCCRILP